MTATDAALRAGWQVIAFSPLVVAVVWIVRPPPFLLSRLRFVSMAIWLTIVAGCWALATVLFSPFLGL